MKLREIITIAKKNIFLLPNGYQYLEGEEHNGVVIAILRKTVNFNYRIGIWIDNKKNYSEFNSTIYYRQLGDIVNPLLVKCGIFTPLRAENDTTLSLKTIEPDLFKRTLNPQYPKVIETEQDIINLLTDLNTYTQEVAEPFFEKWSNLQVLNQFLNQCPQMEIADYLGGYGAYSKLLVYKLCNNPNYEEYLEMMYNHAMKRYKENPNGDIVIKQKHDFMIDFKSILDKTEPIFGI